MRQPTALLSWLESQLHGEIGSEAQLAYAAQSMHKYCAQLEGECDEVGRELRVYCQACLLVCGELSDPQSEASLEELSEALELARQAYQNAEELLECNSAVWA